jgi:hypothetical protein
VGYSSQCLLAGADIVGRGLQDSEEAWGFVDFHREIYLIGRTATVMCTEVVL